MRRSHIVIALAASVLVACGGGGGSSDTTPSAPTGLAASNVASTSLTLCWTASTGATGYTVLSGGATVATTTTACATVTGLTAAQAYTFTVTANDASHTSAASSPLVVTTAPPPPADLAVSEETTTSAKVCWTPSTRATGYTVLNLGSIPLATTTTAATCTTVSGLAAGLSYTFVVTAQDADGHSSDPASVAAATATGDSTCTVPGLPAFASLPGNPRFPDPFRMMDGGRISLFDQWTCRRSQISSLVQGFELGPKPGAPDSVTGDFHAGTNTLTVTCQVGGNTISFDARITYPSTGSGPFPALIGVGASSLDNTALANLGVAIVNFPSDDLAQQVDGSSRGQGKFYTLWGSDTPAGALIAWSWGVSRLIDALEQTPAANIDTSHLGVTGCSRWGKGALVAGAYDDRIALTIPQESGAGGAASWRVSQAQLKAGQNVQTLGEIVGENVWFTSSFSRFGGAVDKLPFDQHEVAGLVAPRGLLVVENTSMEWLGNLSTFTNASATRMIWQGLGVGDRMGYSQLGGHNHCAFPAAQQPEVTAFVSRFLLGQDVDTSVFETDGGFTFDAAKWVDWTVPSLQ